MALGEAEATLDVTDPVLATVREADAIRAAQRLARLGRDRDDAVARTRAIQRCGGRALDDLDTLDVLRIDRRQRTVQDHAVHDVQRVLPATGGRDRRRATEQHGRLVAGTPTRRDDVRPRHLARDLRQRIGRRHDHVGGVDRVRRERHLGGFRRAGHARHDHLRQLVDIRTQRQVDRLRARANHDLPLLRHEADGANAQRHRLPAHLRAGNRDRVNACHVRADRRAQVGDRGVGAQQGIPLLRHHLAGDRGTLGLRLAAQRRQAQRRQRRDPAHKPYPSVHPIPR